MLKGPFDGSQFTATKFDSALDKAAFGNTFLYFIRNDFKRSLFTKTFYRKLSQTFGHIAHYDQTGFYQTWFEEDSTKLSFLKHTLNHPCYGDPEYTYSDVERAVQAEVDKLNLVTIYTMRVERELRNKDLQELERLKKKYEQPIAPSVPPDPIDSLLASRNARTHETEASPGFDREPIQASLF